MHWIHHVGALFAGMFLANSVPHFVYGICGDRFPTPFAKPPGKALSSAPVNMVWALLNLVIGYLLFHTSGVGHGGSVERIVFFVGIAGIGLLSSVLFSEKFSD